MLVLWEIQLHVARNCKFGRQGAPTQPDGPLPGYITCNFQIDIPASFWAMAMRIPIDLTWDATVLACCKISLQRYVLCFTYVGCLAKGHNISELKENLISASIRKITSKFRLLQLQIARTCNICQCTYPCFVVGTDPTHTPWKLQLPISNGFWAKIRNIWTFSYWLSIRSKFEIQ